MNLKRNEYNIIWKFFSGQEVLDNFCPGSLLLPVTGQWNPINGNKMNAGKKFSQDSWTREELIIWKCGRHLWKIDYMNRKLMEFTIIVSIIISLWCLFN